MQEVVYGSIDLIDDVLHRIHSDALDYADDQLVEDGGEDVGHRADHPVQNSDSGEREGDVTENKAVRRNQDATNALTRCV